MAGDWTLVSCDALKPEVKKSLISRNTIRNSRNQFNLGGNVMKVRDTKQYIDQQYIDQYIDIANINIGLCPGAISIL